MIRIVLVEDHRLFREGVKKLLSGIDDFRIVAEYSTGKEYTENLFDIETDIVLMDIEMPEMGGLEATQLSKFKRPGVNIIALSMYSDQKYYYEMIRAGVSGFVLKEASPEELEKAIRDVHNGMGFFSPELLHQAIIQGSNQEKKNTITEKLKISARELEILELICKGLNNSTIAEKLFLSPRTVESHKARLLRKTGTNNSAELIIFAIKNDLVRI